MPSSAARSILNVNGARDHILAEKVFDMNSDCVHLVRVTTSDGESRLWAAATSREEAVEHVLQAVPDGWSARLMDGTLKPQPDAIQTMNSGEVRELAK